MHRYLLTLLLGLSMAAAPYTNADAVDDLLTQLSFRSLQGAFVQYQYDEQGAELGQASGFFKLLRPGYFLWEIQAPDSQLIVATPEFVWHHDRDLETVSRRPVSDDAEMAPLQVLGGDEATLREHFSVVAQGEGRFLLRPVTGQDNFSELTVTVREQSLSRMEVLDTLGQRYVIELADLDTQSELQPADFSFTPPAGADLFYHDE